LPPVNWVGTVYHGLPLDLLRFQESRAEGYLAFLGRISPEKHPDRAIEIARHASLRIRVAAKVDDADGEYFEHKIKPLFRDPLVEFIGEIDDAHRSDFLGSARALIFPIDWPEPFGLVMIEAMACGAPVIAFARGSVSEVIEEGVAGFLVNNIDEACIAGPWPIALPRCERRINNLSCLEHDVVRRGNDPRSLIYKQPRIPAPW
jgi:glycosyltransferase involved in cell wall biosynthesis